ncbi:hypothetical protein PHABIO_282 [Pseudomonas phage Phabio]|uniref:Uncharacterized protein n=1 Tax=Pseudomonas phage Phabio TaxID=2006668 RepID=A0A1Y0SYS4_9CAUD|nr:hypothetical protein MZD05_gp282 [Pseudomonas phage Phabio]ARV76913.1 hypothetical protein PHABIO_282 [Pseudomonas phage Phabio]
MSQSDKRLKNTIPAASLDLDNKNYEGRIFCMVRNNELTVVRLVKVKRRDVYLEYVKGDRKDGFTRTKQEFRKFYHLCRNRTTDEELETLA